MISFELATDLAGTRRFLEAVQVFALAESLGGVESLIEHPAIMTHATIPAETRAALGIGDGWSASRSASRTSTTCAPTCASARARSEPSAAHRRSPMEKLPVIDVRGAADAVARGIGDACRAHGFFYVVGHGVDAALGARLEDAEPSLLRPARGGEGALRDAARRPRLARLFPARRRADLGPARLEGGLYLGSELGRRPPARAAGMPLHGRNLFPGDDVLPGFRATSSTTSTP